MSPSGGSAWGRVAGFPRVSGDEPRDTDLGGEERPFSPRERG